MPPILAKRSLRALVAAALLVSACSTEKHAPVASIAIVPAHMTVVKGTSLPLDVLMLDSAGSATTADVAWTTSAPAVATVSDAGVVSGVGYGVATISAGVSGQSASVEVVVTAPPVTGAYSVVDLTPVPRSTFIFTNFNDSGHVLMDGRLYRDGMGAAVPGCNPVALNNRSHLLCVDDASVAAAFRRYSIWRAGAVSPVSPVDTFAAAGFRAYALNDSDVVAGLYSGPTFSNPSCVASRGSCLVLWRNGQPTFPGQYDTQGHDVLLLNNRLDLVVESPGNYDIFAVGNPWLYSLASGQRLTLGAMAQAINGQGWAALALVVDHHGTNSYTQLSAMVYRPDGTITLGTGEATGINDAGAVVGTLFAGPFLWTPAGGVSLLTKAATDQGWTISSAMKINNRGQILAQASHADGRAGHWVVLTPVAH